MVSGRLGVRAALFFGAIFALRCGSDVSTPEGVTHSERAVTASPVIGDFAVYGRNSLVLRASANVVGGDSGAQQTGPSSSLPEGNRVSVWALAKISLGKRLLGDSVLLRAGATVGDVYTTKLTDKGATRGALFPFPVMPAFPTAAAVIPGTGTTTISGTKALCPGKYGDVVLTQGASLRLMGGLYELKSLQMLSKSRIEALGTVQIRVATQLRARDRTYIGAAAGVSLTAKAIRIDVMGPNITDPDEVEDDPAVRVAVFGALGEVRAIVLAPNGRLVIKGGQKATGAFLAQDVTVGIATQVKWEDGFSNPALGPGCDDANPCTTDTCSAGACAHQNVAAGGACAGGNACTGAGTCDAAGHCQSGPAPVVDDNNPCTTDSCDPATGVKHTPVAAGTSCTDNNACNGAEACDSAGHCQPGTVPPIDDSNPCTADSCDTATGVKHVPVAAGTACSDGNACNGAEACNAVGTCAAGTSPPIDDANPCTTDACDAVAGVTHVPVANGTGCPDGTACNGAETCVAGICTAGAPLVVDDANLCTADACDPVTGVSHVALPVGTSCADGNACNGGETCNGGGACVSGTPPVIDDGNICTADSCDPVTGVLHSFVVAGTSCANGTVCDGLEACDGAGRCMPGSGLPVDDANPCTVDGCDPIMGVSHIAVTAGVACTAGDVCSGVGTCDGAGGCQAGSPASLDDGNPCTADSCDPSTGVHHTPVAVGVSCADGNACNGAESCDASGMCQAGAVEPIDDGNPCTADGCDPATGVFHTVVVDCIPDPKTIAPPADVSVASNVFDTTAFLYTGSNPIQSGVAPGTIQLARAAVIRGKVSTRDGTPLAGAKVAVLNHPEFGQTLSGESGMFDLAVNGGGTLTLDYSAGGFLPAQRQVAVPWNEFSFAPDVVLVPLDSAVTPIDLSAATPIQVARGNPVSDSDGSRRATLLFQAGTSAAMALPDGSTQPLTTLDIRATEYTVGATGFQAMPGDLPPPSAYTYALELSIDQALAAKATRVDFNRPVSFYVENFLNFPVGMAVPLGYYDRGKGAWVASPNGKVIKVLAVVAGTATLDTDGDGAADDATKLAALGVTDVERTQLGSLYVAGQSLWRMAVTHFTTYDCNWPYWLPADARGPAADAPTSDEPVDAPTCKGGSIIECQNQNLGERVGLSGTPFDLNYRSNRTPGHKASHTITVPLQTPGESLPASLKAIQVELIIGGRFIPLGRYTPGTPAASYLWDGIGGYDQALQGEQSVKVNLGYVYDAVYRAPGSGGASFGGGGGSVLESRARREFTIWSTTHTIVSTWNSLAQGLGGWSINAVHGYDPGGKVLYLGDGSQRSSESKILDTIDLFAGSAATAFDCGATGDGGPALGARLFTPWSLAAGPDGSIYIADFNNARVRRVSPSGIITTIAGSGAQGYSGDEGPASAAGIGRPFRIGAGPDGSVYFNDFDRSVIRRITPDGIIHTFAGTGASGFTGDGGPATSAQISLVEGFAFGPDGSVYMGVNTRVRRVGPDGIISTVAGGGSVFGTAGNDRLATEVALLSSPTVAMDPYGVLYIAESNGSQIRRMAPDGTQRIIAGNGVATYGGDDGPAVLAKFSNPGAIALGPDGSLYVNDQGNFRLRRITPDGLISTISGTGVSTYTGEGGMAAQAGLEAIRSLAINPRGEVFLGDILHCRVRRIHSALPGLTAGDTLIASENGSELYAFNGGRHLRTIDAHTKALRLQMSYDAAGRLSSLTDGDGKTTTIERDGTGKPSAVIGHFGQRNPLQLDGNGYLSRVSNAETDAVKLTTSPTGLLSTLTDPRDKTYIFTYDLATSRLSRDDDPAGGFKTLTRTGNTKDYTVALATALGRTSSYRVENLPGDKQRRTDTGTNTLTTVSIRDAAGTTTKNLPDGTQSSVTLGSDARWGMLSPIVRSFRLTTPQGLIFNTSASHSVTLATPTDPLTLTSETKTLTVNGRVYTSSYDAALRKLTLDSPLHRKLIAFTDTHGRLTRQQVVGLDDVVYHYDSVGRLDGISTGAGPELRTATLTYDPQGFVSTITDALTHMTTFTYDNVGRVREQTLPDGRVIGYTYDASGNVTTVTPPSRPVHGFDYDDVNQQSLYTPPDIGFSPRTTRYDYNVDRQLTLITRPDGKTIEYTYDTAGRLETQILPSGIRTYTYHPTTGHLTDIAAPGENVTYTYDGALPLTETWSGEVSGTVGRSFDSNLRTASISINGAPIVLLYDNDSLLRQVGGFVLTHDPANGLLTDTTLDTITTKHLYTTFGETKDFSARAGGALVYQAKYIYDRKGRVHQKDETVSGVTDVFVYTYDPAGRLTDVERNGSTLSHYTYDGNSNRETKTDSGGTTTGTYDNQDRLNQYGADSYTYTPNGELKTKTSGTATTTYTYDVRGNLTSVALPDGTPLDYVIDGRNRRIGKKRDGVLVQGFLYQNQLHPIAELDASGAIVSRFVYGVSDTPDYMVKAGVSYRIISDHVGSPRLVINASTGVTAQRLDYDEFGNVTADSNPGFQPFGFAGGLYDRDTNLVRFGARDYDPLVGRWVSKDPIGFRGGDSNQYGYVANDPINFIDPWGLIDLPAGEGREDIANAEIWWVIMKYDVPIDPAIAIYNPSIKEPMNAAWSSINKRINVGDGAFKSEGWLASSIYHESIHKANEEACGAPISGDLANAKDELDAFTKERSQSDRFNLTDAEKTKIDDQIRYWERQVKIELDKVIDRPF